MVISCWYHQPLDPKLSDHLKSLILSGFNRLRDLQRRATEFVKENFPNRVGSHAEMMRQYHRARISLTKSQWLRLPALSCAKLRRMITKSRWKLHILLEFKELKIRPQTHWLYNLQLNMNSQLR